MIYQYFYRLVSNLEALLFYIAGGYLLLKIYQPDTLEEIRMAIVSLLIRGKIDSSNRREIDKARYPHPKTEVHSKVSRFDKEIIEPFYALQNLDDAATRKYLNDQQESTDEYFMQDENISGVYQKFSKKLARSFNPETIDNPINFGRNYFFFKRLRPELLQYSLFCTHDLNKDARLVFDPNTIRFNEDAEIDINNPVKGMPIVHATWISEDGNRIAYGYTNSCTSKDMTIRVRDIRLSTDLSIDIVNNCKVDFTSLVWIESRTGFFYTTQVILIDSETQRQKISNRVMFHRMGTSQISDFAVFETITDHDELVINVIISSDRHYLLLDMFKRARETSEKTLWRSVASEHCPVSQIGNKVYFFDLSKFDGMYAISLGDCVKLIDTFLYRFDYISNIEEDFWFRTNYKAPNFRVVRITLPVNNADDEDETGLDMTYRLLQSWRNCLDWIPQRVDGDYLESAGIAAHTVLVLKYLRNSYHEVLLYDLTQNLVEESQKPVAELPHSPYGTIVGPNCNFYSSEIFYQYSDYAEVTSIYRALIIRDPFTGAIEISFHEVSTTMIPDIEKHKFDTVLEYCETKKNVYIPLLKFGKKNLVNEGDNVPRPCILVINGGFGVCATPKVSLPFLLYAQHCRGIVIFANIQGSGIYGKKWALAGSKENKQEGVSDIYCIIKYLIRKKYTTESQLALFGGSYNGLLIGAAIAQSPNMFNAAVIVDGILDLVNYHQYNDCLDWSRDSGDSKEEPSAEEKIAILKETTWYQEYGCSSESAEEFERIFSLSPLHNISKKSDITSFPAVYLLADTRPGESCADRVSFIHSMKFIAELQRIYGKINPNQPLLLDLSGWKYKDEEEKEESNAFSNSDYQNPCTNFSLEETSRIFAFIIKHTKAEWT